MRLRQCPSQARRGRCCSVCPVRILSLFFTVPSSCVPSFGFHKNTRSCPPRSGSNGLLAVVSSRGYLLTDRLGIPLTPCSVSKFLSLETSVQIHSSVRDEDVFILQSPSPPSINDHLMELLIMISGQSLTSTGGIELIIQLARLLPPSESPLSSLVSHILGRTRKTSLELQSPPSQSGPSLQQGTANV